MALAKPRGQWRYDDLLTPPEDARRYEIIEGDLYEMPAPNLDHATVVINLIALFLPVVRSLRARLFTAPVDVFFAGADPVQPDLVVLLPHRLDLLRNRGIEGAPNLLVEVLSPTNPNHDLVRKRELYARAGVPEYWLVDPEARAIEVLRLAGAAYRSGGRLTGEARVGSAVLPALAFPAAAAFALLGE